MRGRKARSFDRAQTKSGASGTPVEPAIAFFSEIRGLPAKVTEYLVVSRGFRISDEFKATQVLPSIAVRPPGRPPTGC